MTSAQIQAAAVTALRRFLSDELNITALEHEIASLWVANNRELDGPLGEIYDVVTDWDHKYTLREAIDRLRHIAMTLDAAPN